MYKSEEEDDSFILLKGNGENLVKGLDAEDFAIWHPIHKAEIKNQMLRIKGLIDMYVPEEARFRFAEAIQGALMVQARLAMTEINKARSQFIPKNAHRGARKKGEAMQALIRRIAKEHRNVDGSPKTASQLVGPVQAELEKQKRPRIGVSRKSGKVDENSAARTVRRYLEGYTY